MPLWNVRTPGGTVYQMESDQPPTADEIEGFLSKQSRPTRATLPWDEPAPPRDPMERAGQDWIRMRALERTMGYKPLSLAGAGQITEDTPYEVGGTQITRPQSFGLPYFRPPEEAGVGEKIAAGTWNVGASVPNFFLSPAGIATALMPATLPARFAQPIIKGTFLGLTTKAAAEAVGTASVTKDPQDITEAALSSLFPPIIGGVRLPLKGAFDAQRIRTEPRPLRPAGRQPEVVQDQGRQDVERGAPPQPEPVGAGEVKESEVLLKTPPDYTVEAEDGRIYHKRGDTWYDAADPTQPLPKGSTAADATAEDKEWAAFHEMLESRAVREPPKADVEWEHRARGIWATMDVEQRKQYTGGKYKLAEEDWDRLTVPQKKKVAQRMGAIIPPDVAPETLPEPQQWLGDRGPVPAGYYRITEGMTVTQGEAVKLEARKRIQAAWGHMTDAEKEAMSRGAGLPKRFGGVAANFPPPKVRKQKVKPRPDEPTLPVPPVPTHAPPGQEPSRKEQVGPSLVNWEVHAKNAWDNATDQQQRRLAGNRADLPGQYWEQLTPQEKALVGRNAGLNVPEPPPVEAKPTEKSVIVEPDMRTPQQRGNLSDEEWAELSAILEEATEEHNVNVLIQKASQRRAKEQAKARTEAGIDQGEMGLGQFSVEPGRGMLFATEPGGDTIYVNPENVGRAIRSWRARGLTMPQIREALKAKMFHENVHRYTSPEQALNYWNSLSFPEKMVETRLYLGEWSRGRYAERMKMTPFSDTQMGWEAVRRRIQRIHGMTPDEIVTQVGAGRWSVRGIEALANTLRGMRELLGTRQSRVGIGIVGSVLQKLSAAQQILAENPGIALSALRRGEEGEEWNDRAHPAVPLAPRGEAILNWMKTSLAPSEWQSMKDNGAIDYFLAKKRYGWDEVRAFMLDTVQPTQKEVPFSTLQKGEEREQRYPVPDVTPGLPSPKPPEPAPAPAAAAAPAAPPKPAVPEREEISLGEETATGEVIPSAFGMEFLAQEYLRAIPKKKGLKSAGLLEVAEGSRPALGTPPPEQIPEKVAEEKFWKATGVTAPTFDGFVKFMRRRTGTKQLEAGQIRQLWKEAVEKMLLGDIVRVRGETPELRAQQEMAGKVGQEWEPLSGEDLAKLRAAKDLNRELGARPIPDAPKVVQPGEPQWKTEEAFRASGKARFKGRRYEEPYQWTPPDEPLRFPSKTTKAQKDFNEAQRYRLKVIGALYHKFMDEAGMWPDLQRAKTSITADDINYGTDKADGGYVKIYPEDTANLTKLGKFLTAGARSSKGGEGSATKKLVTLFDNKTQQVHLVSVYPEYQGHYTVKEMAGAWPNMTGPERENAFAGMGFPERLIKTHPDFDPNNPEFYPPGYTAPDFPPGTEPVGYEPIPIGPQNIPDPARFTVKPPVVRIRNPASLSEERTHVPLKELLDMRFVPTARSRAEIEALVASRGVPEEAREAEVARLMALDSLEAAKNPIPRFIPLASVSLLKPVKNFLQTFPNTGAYADAVGRQARFQALLTAEPSILTERTEAPTEGSQFSPESEEVSGKPTVVAKSGVFVQGRGLLEMAKRSPLTSAEAKALYAHILDELPVGRMVEPVEGPPKAVEISSTQDFYSAIDALAEKAKTSAKRLNKRKLSWDELTAMPSKASLFGPRDRLAFAALAKVARRYWYSGSFLTKGQAYEHAIKTLYNTFKNSEVEDAFAVRLLAQFGPKTPDPYAAGERARPIGYPETSESKGVVRELYGPETPPRYAPYRIPSEPRVEPGPYLPPGTVLPETPEGRAYEEGKQIMVIPPWQRVPGQVVGPREQGFGYMGTGGRGRELRPLATKLIGGKTYLERVGPQRIATFEEGGVELPAEPEMVPDPKMEMTEEERVELAEIEKIQRELEGEREYKHEEEPKRIRYLYGSARGMPEPQPWEIETERVVKPWSITAPASHLKGAPAAEAAGRQAQYQAWLQGRVPMNPAERPMSVASARDAVEDRVRKTNAQVVGLFSRRDTKRVIPQLLDASEHAATQMSGWAGNAVRLASIADRPPGIKLDLWMKNRREREAEALKVRGAAIAVIATGRDVTGPSGPIWSPMKAGLNRLWRDVQDAMGNAQLEIAGGNPRVGRAWLKGAQDLAKTITYASNHWNDPALKKTVQAIREELRNARDYEVANGLSVKDHANYYPGIMESEFWDGDSVNFGRSRLLGTKYVGPKRFKDHYDAIKNGPYIPASLDAAAAVQHRVMRGARTVEKKLWQQTLKHPQFKDPITGKQIAMDPKPNLREVEELDPLTGKMAKVKRIDPDHPWVPPAPDYELVGEGRPMAVHTGYSSMVKALLQPSPVKNWDVMDVPVGQALINASAMLKHSVILVFDTFHPARLAWYQAASSIGMGKRVGYKGGYSALSYRPNQMADAVRKGYIKQADADWANETVTLRDSRGSPIRMTRRDLARNLIESGLNASKLTDAIYKDAIRRIPLVGHLVHRVLGPYNRWLFDRLIPGMMVENAVRSLESLNARNPNVSLLKLMQDVVRDTNTYFGNMGKQGVFRSDFFRDLAQIVLLAPMWLEGLVAKEVRGAGRAITAAEYYTRKGLRGLGAPVPQATFAQKAFGRTGLPPVGALGASMAAGLGGFFILTQLLNMASRQRPTWENPEEGHKLDAWFKWGGGEGLWVSPMSIFAETLHDVMRLSETKPKVWDAIVQVGENKLGPVGKALNILKTGRDPNGVYLTSTRKVLTEALSQVIPLWGAGPISISRPFQYVRHKVQPTAPVVPPEAFSQQVAGSFFGIKAQRKLNAVQEIQQMARNFVRKQGKGEDLVLGVTDEPSYHELRRAVHLGDDTEALRVLSALRKTRNEGQILTAMQRFAQHPFTSSHPLEFQFRLSLTPEQMEIYNAAQAQRLMEYYKFLGLYMRGSR